MSDRFKELSNFLDNASEADFEALKAGVLKRLDEANKADPMALAAVLANSPAPRSILPSLRKVSEYLDAEVSLPHMKNTDSVEPYATPHFRVGDIVTRDGTDRHRVIATNGTDECAPDLIEVECIKEPSVEYCDGTFGEPWIRLGEREHNIPRRYQLVETI